jgi:hypothetical protein
MSSVQIEQKGCEMPARGRNGEKRAIMATARKLAALPHHLWVSGEVYKPCTTGTKRRLQPPRNTDGHVKIVPENTYEGTRRLFTRAREGILNRERKAFSS